MNAQTCLLSRRTINFWWNRHFCRHFPELLSSPTASATNHNISALSVLPSISLFDILLFLFLTMSTEILDFPSVSIMSPVSYEQFEDSNQSISMHRITSNNSVNTNNANNNAMNDNMPSLFSSSLKLEEISALPLECSFDDWDNSTAAALIDNPIGQIQFDRETSLSEFSYQSTSVSVNEFSPVTEPADSMNYSEQEEASIGEFSYSYSNSTADINQELSQQFHSIISSEPNNEAQSSAALLSAPIKKSNRGRKPKYVILESQLSIGSTNSSAVSSTVSKKRRAKAESIDNNNSEQDDEKAGLSDDNSINTAENSSNPAEGDTLDKRQRNKLSASQYRKRRKMYLQSLESQVSSLNDNLSDQTDKLNELQTENKVLKEQLEFMKKLLNNNSSTPTSAAELNIVNSLRMPSNTKIPPEFRPVAPSAKISKKERGNNVNSVGMMLFVLFSCFIFYSPIFTSNSTSNPTISVPVFPISSANSQLPSNLLNSNTVHSSGRAGRMLLNFFEEEEEGELVIQKNLELLSIVDEAIENSKNQTALDNSSCHQFDFVESEADNCIVLPSN
jgi:hypothetical protein